MVSVAEKESEMIRILYTHNPWWITGSAPKELAHEFRRRDFYKLREQLDLKEITGIVGARRVGKTTLMYQLIENLLEHIEPKRVMYLKVDDPYISANIENVQQIFLLYSIHVLNEPLENLSEKVYIMLDEVQVLEDWELLLKRFYDLGYKIKFVISGSSSPQIVQRGAESLVGRFHPQLVCPLKFLEVLRYYKREKDPNRKYDNINWELRKALQESVNEGDPTTVFSAFERASLELAIEKDWILIRLNDYLIRGGYPAVVSSDDYYRSTEILRDHLDLTIYRDIIKTFNIRDPKSFESLFIILASECCQRHNYDNLSKEMGIKWDTVKDYVFYLTHSYLISESRYYSRNVRTQMKNDKKIYINDNGLRNSVLGLIDKNVISNTLQLGRLAENAVADHTKRLVYNLGQVVDSSIYYWYDRNGHEVDIILDIFGKPVPIEVKYRTSISTSELKGIKNFIKKYNSEVNIVVTRDTLEQDELTIRVPLWLFLLLC